MSMCAGGRRWRRTTGNGLSVGCAALYATPAGLVGARPPKNLEQQRYTSRNTTGASMKRSPLQRNNGLKRQSKKGKDRRDDWVERRDEQLRVRPKCEANWGTPCWGPITVHHRLPRGMGGTAHDESPLVTLCSGHHGYVEEHREWAREHGWLIKK